MQDQDIINEEERHEAATETPISESKSEVEVEERSVPLAHFPSGADGTEPAGASGKATLPALVKRFAMTPHTFVMQSTLPSGRILSVELESESTDHLARAHLYDDDRPVCRIEFFCGYQSRNITHHVTKGAFYKLVSRAGHMGRYRRNKAKSKEVS